MTNYFDDDSFWDEPTSGSQANQIDRATSQISRVTKRTPDRTRSHHVVVKGSTPPPLDYDDPSDDLWLEPASRFSGLRGERMGAFASIDPRLLGVGAIAIAAVLTVPLFGALSGDDDGGDGFRSVAEAQASTTTTVAPPTTSPASEIVVMAAVSPEAIDEPEADSTDPGNSDSESQSDESAASGGATPGGAGGAVDPATCPNTYEVSAGDYWLRIAEASGTDLTDVLEANGANAETALYPGKTICLPAGAATPAPSTAAPTTAAPTTAAPTTAPPTTDPPTTAPPTTDPPTTDAPDTTRPQGPVPSGGEVEAMIREIWPDDLEDQAVRIAWRESNFRPGVTSSTGCCHGVFQIHWPAHQSWLSQMGITSVDELFDARTNIEAAFTLYQRSDGWGPWAATSG